MKQKLSVCIITYNEEHYISKLIDNIESLADEILIIDSQSSDNTVKIIKNHPSKKIHLIETERTPMFIANKQKAIEQAKFDWILQLDADELLTEELKNEMRQILEDPQYDGYQIPRKNFFLTGYLMKGGVYPDYVVRLYKKDKAHFVLKDIHENVIIDGTTGTMNHDLLHDSDPTFYKYLSRWIKYTEYEAERLYKKGEQLNFFSYVFIKPIWWFLKTYVRHLGFLDGMRGFIFHYFSSLRFVAIYVYYWSKYVAKK